MAFQLVRDKGDYRGHNLRTIEGLNIGLLLPRRRPFLVSLSFTTLWPCIKCQPAVRFYSQR